MGSALAEPEAPAGFVDEPPAPDGFVDEPPAPAGFVDELPPSDAAPLTAVAEATARYAAAKTTAEFEGQSGPQISSLERATTGLVRPSDPQFPEDYLAKAALTAINPLAPLLNLTESGKGVVEGVERTAEALVTPENIAIAGSLAGAPAAIAKAAGVGFAGLMVPGVAQSAKEFKEAKTPREAAAAATSGLLGAGLAVAGVAPAVHGIAGKLKAVRDPFAPETAKAVAESPDADVLARTNEVLSQPVAPVESQPLGQGPAPIAAEKAPAEATPAPVVSRPAETVAAEAVTAPVGELVRDASRPEQMTPEEAGVVPRPEGKAPSSPSNVTKRFGAEGLKSESATPEAVARWKAEHKAYRDYHQQAKKSTETSNAYWYSIEDAVKSERPISEAAKEFRYGEDAPDGYVKRGELFVHEPTTVPGSEGPGAAAAKAEASLPEWTSATEPTSTPAPEPAATPVGILPPGMPQMLKGAGIARAAVGKIVSAIKDIPAFHDMRKSVLGWSARNQKSTFEIRRAHEGITKAVPDAVRREGITNWIQAGGDTAALAQRAAATHNLKLRKGYEAAASLTPEEVGIANQIKQTYDVLLKRAQSYGINISELDNYVTQIWKRDKIKEFVASSNRRLSGNVRFAKQRFYESYFEGEQAGLKPQSKDISKILPIYMNEVNNAIASRQFVENMSKGKASDGRPLVAPRGGVTTIDDTAGTGQVHLVFPEKATKETADYKVLSQPALHDWRWRGEDTEGNPIMVKGDLAVHPEAYTQLKNVLGQSAIREWWNSQSESPLADMGKAATKFLVDDVQSVAKATMLGFLSPFHAVQEGTHAVGHKVNPFANIPKVDLNNPAQLDAARHGLMIAADRISAQQFREGLDGSSRNLLSNAIGKIPKVGERIKQFSDDFQTWLFESYIPGLKIKTYDAMVERNTKRHVDELASGAITESQVKYLSAQQSNAAYGHLNYADISRNPTIQHVMQMFLLAPDFLEARGRFTGQAAKGIAAKSGREQFAAMALLAATFYASSRILNQVADGDPHWDEPFAVISGNRRYAMRSVPADIYHAVHDTRKFISGRLSPVIGRGVLEGLTGVNYRGEPTEFTETIRNIIAGMVPLSVQPFTRGLSETSKDNPVSPLEQLMGSSGLHVSRYSPVSEIYKLAGEWQKEHAKEYGLDKKRGVFPISKYQQLRYALDDNDAEKAAAEVARLMGEEKVDRRNLSIRFTESMRHPFTGSKETDKAFRSSLPKKDQELYDAAVKRRETLLLRFKALPH